MIKRIPIVLLVIVLTSCAENQPKVDISKASSGRTIYLGKCNACHGSDGKKGLGGAKDLSTSELTNNEIKEIITNGKGSMAGYSAILSEEEVGQVAEYITTLRK
ncbi:MAG: cytochrome c [Flavobacteriales bacterium]|nr:cytochrome c [Flavobacteriales bacterium]